MSKLISDYIFTKDFKRSGHKLLLKNETSGTYFLQSDLMQINELHENGMSFSIPNGHLQKGHIVTLFFYPLEKVLNIKATHLSPVLKETEFQIIAKVENLNIDPKSNQAHVSVIFQQYNVVEWKKIIDKYESKQEEINDLISKQLSRGDKAGGKDE